MISVQADLLHKTDCIQKRPMTAITAIGRKMLGTEGNSALAELGRATSSLQAVLREFLSCFPLILRDFPAFCLSVIRCADHKKRHFFIQQ